MQKYQYFNGVKFTRDDKTGYYLNSTIRKRMHRYVWEYYNGEVPEGYQIHHIDKDKSNNDISNLEAIPFSAHAKMHNLERAERMHDEMVENLRVNALPRAAEWHRSEEGRKWHREQYEKTQDLLRIKQTLVCEMCGNEYTAHRATENRFCSNRCKAAWRRKSGADDETWICAYCGAEFTTNKYSKTETCSRACANRKRTLK